MKFLSIIFATFLASFAWTSCQNADARYIDLETGDAVVLEKDEKTGAMINVETGKPVRLYVNSKSKDTIYGPSGKIVNNEVILLDRGVYVYADDPEYKLKLEGDGDYKQKWGDDNKVK